MNSEMTPQQMADRRYALSVEYGRISNRLGDISQGKAIKWLLLRKEAKSSKEADMLWESTENGQEELKLKYQGRGIEKEISSLSSLLRIKELEIKNLI